MRIDKSVVIYILQSGSKYHCNECSFISPEGNCTNYVIEDSDVKSYGGCNDWQPLSRGRIKGIHARTREETGYVENKVGFSCGRCKEFLPEAKRCEIVKGFISPCGCCNAWQKDRITGDLPEDKLRSMKEFQ